MTTELAESMEVLAVTLSQVTELVNFEQPHPIQSTCSKK